MVKKILVVLIMIALGLGIVGCGADKKSNKKADVKEETTKKEEEKFVAFITDVGSIDDKSFNEGSWKGVIEFAEKNNYKKEYFRPAENTPARDTRSGCPT